MSEMECVIVLGKRSAEGWPWCQTCMHFVQTLPRTATEQFFGDPPIRLQCPREAEECRPER